MCTCSTNVNHIVSCCFGANLLLSTSVLFEYILRSFTNMQTISKHTCFILQQEPPPRNQLPEDQPPRKPPDQPRRPSESQPPRLLESQLLKLPESQPRKLLPQEEPESESFDALKSYVLFKFFS